MIELNEWIQQKKICRHTEAILSTIKHGLSNARYKIKLTIRMGYGFRNIDNLIALVMLRCSGINLLLPMYSTHSIVINIRIDEYFYFISYETDDGRIS